MVDESNMYRVLSDSFKEELRKYRAENGVLVKANENSCNYIRVLEREKNKIEIELKRVSIKKDSTKLGNIDLAKRRALHEISDSAQGSVRVYHAFNVKEKNVGTDIKDLRLQIDAFKVDSDGNRIGGFAKKF